MSLSEEQFREQLVDYLYGELDDAQRAAFEASLSPEQRAEVDAMRATLRAARTGFSALEEEPPARLRGAILDASRGQVVVLKPWYRRGSTLAPALAAAAALTFAVLAPRRDEQPGAELAKEPPAPAALPEVEDRKSEALEDQAVEGLGRAGPATNGLESKGKLEPERAKKRDQAPARRARGPQAEGALREADDSAEKFAQPPAGWGSGGGAAPAADKATRAASPREQEALPAEPAPPAAPVLSAPARPAKSAAPAAEESRAEAPAAKPRDASPERAPQELVERAQEHKKARRWSEAVIAYRELLQRYPKDERAASWRSELSDAARRLSVIQ